MDREDEERLTYLARIINDNAEFEREAEAAGLRRAPPVVEPLDGALPHTTAGGRADGGR